MRAFYNLATDFGARTVASWSCAVPTWHAILASGWRCRRQPACCHRLARLQRLNALKSLCSWPLRGGLPVLCSRWHQGAVLDSWSRGCRAAVLELELPEAALSPPGRFTAEPLPEGWSSLYLKIAGPRIPLIALSRFVLVATSGLAPLGVLRAEFSKRAQRALRDDLCGAVCDCRCAERAGACHATETSRPFASSDFL